MHIYNINGNPYTSAEEDGRLEELKKQARETLGKEITRAMQRAKFGRMEIDAWALDHFLEQAYYMGKEEK